MQKRKLFHGSISENIYEITDRTEMRAEHLADSMKRLAAEYLRGSVELNVSGESGGTVDISVSSTAQIIKMMLANLAADDMLKINLHLGSELRIELAPKCLPSTPTLAKIITFAKSAGFTVKRDQTTITMTAVITERQVLSIYAISADEIYDELYDIIIST